MSLRCRLGGGRYHGNGDVGNGIGVQRHFHFVFADCFERTVRQADVGFNGFYAGGNDGGGDVGIGYGTEQTAVHAGFLGDGDGLAVEFLLASLSVGQSR